MSKLNTPPLRSQEQGAESLLYLYSNNSIEEPKVSDKEATIGGLTALLSSYHKRQAQTLFLNVKRLIDLAPTTGHIGFLTLTFPDNVVDNKEASRRFNSLKTNFLNPHPDFGHSVTVKERQKRGAWHYHIIIHLKEDIRTGVDFDAIEKGNYSSASPYLRSLWADLRGAMSKYGFGRSELLPIRKGGEAMGRYVGKYISKHMGARDEQDKGVRLVSYSTGWVKNSVNFAWYTDGSKEWRKKLKIFAQYMGCTEFYQLTDKLGTGWAYKYAEDIDNAYDLLLEMIGGKKCPDYESVQLKKITERRSDHLARRDRSKKEGRYTEWKKEDKNLSRRKKKIRESKEDVALAIGDISGYLKRREAELEWVRCNVPF